MSRYLRQTCLPEVGETGQTLLASARILVVGAGGLGCAALPYLVGAGVGQITLVDGDVVSLSNLHRQVLYREADVDLPKVECAKRHLDDLNNNCVITTHFTTLTPSNVDVFCHEMDVILDCADNFAVSYVLSDYCHAHNLKLVSASALGFKGYIGGFCGGKPSLRAIFPELPQRAENCSSAGVMGPIVGTIGCLQAQFTLNLLLNIEPSPLGQLVSIDLHNLRQSGFRFDDAPEPSENQLLGFIDTDEVTSQDWLVDLRKINKQEGVQYFTLDEFDQQQAQPHTHQRAVLVCRTGLTAWRAARKLQTYWQGEIKLIALGDDPL
ncbi:thiazole biosynthesis protein ThiF [Marinomonas ushuaiensis DSM 15871]|uniref:Thiazole biosynthesis protein ThiF n=1 Tax=Marinomonas ushuaiensis DSM 15871 TaxID=1122207 RepID=X7E562_9GAMM|nr:HesA/MoeB/ThiF family protein [Marinomonas ushuaiensis]ETX10303.1 thiazole biosynthesis protein ThiF [Marinomonas ushuaiensis DSM 15871]